MIIIIFYARTKNSHFSITKNDKNDQSYKKNFIYCRRIV